MPPAPQHSPAQLSDFPDWLDPMSVKELRQGLRSRVFFWNFFLLHATMIVWMIASAQTTGTGTGGGNFGEGFFWVVLVAGLLLIPLRAANALRGERAGNTFELIKISSLSAWQIVFGKWSALMFQATLLVVSLLPYACVRYFFGDADFFKDAFLISLYFSLTALGVAGGVLVSHLNKSGIIILGVVGFFTAPFFLGIFFAITTLGFRSFTVMSEPISFAGGIAATLFYGICYSMLILGLAALPLAGALESTGIRLKILGLFFMLVPLIAVVCGAPDGLWLTLFGLSVPGAIFSFFYSLGGRITSDKRAVEFFQKENKLIRASAWLVAPSNDAGVRNAAFVAGGMITAFATGIFILLTDFPAPAAFAWLAASVLPGILLPVIFLRRFGKKLIGAEIATLTIVAGFCFVLAVFFLCAFFGKAPGVWDKTAICAVPFGALYDVIATKTVSLPAAACVAGHWIILVAGGVASEFFRRRRGVRKT